MKQPSRRSFLSSAAVTVTGLGVSADQRASGQSTEIFRKQYSFVLRPDALVRTDSGGGVVAANPWALAQSDQDLLPYLSGDIPVPLIDDGSALCLPCSVPGEPAETFPVQQRFLDFRPLGEFPTTDLISEVVRARADNLSLDLWLQVADEASANPRLTETIIQPRAPGLVAQFARWQSPTVSGYFIQFRGPDLEGMVPCAPEAPKHYHAELWKQTSPGRYTSLVNLHIAIWKSAPGKYCFALANSKGWPACIKFCNPTWNDIYKPVLAALLTAGVAYLVATALASLLATLIYGSLAVLAV